MAKALSSAMSEALNRTASSSAAVLAIHKLSSSEYSFTKNDHVAVSRGEFHVLPEPNTMAGRVRVGGSVSRGGNEYCVVAEEQQRRLTLRSL